MTWFKVDDRFPTHRKVMGLPRGQRRVAAVGAWTLLGAWCAANGTEGHVSTALVEEFGIPSRPISDLIGAGLLEHADGGYVLHDYLDYNPTAEQVAADRIAARERQRRARERARESRTAREDRHAVTNGVSHGPVTPGVTVPPTRPDPTYTDAYASAAPAALPAQREPDEPVTAQTLLTEYVNGCRARPPERVRGQLGQQIKALLAEGIPVEHVRAGLALFAANPKHPSVLPSLVNEAMNPGHRAQPRSTTDERVGQALALAAKYRALEERS